jgi:hypothetical protein
MTAASEVTPTREDCITYLEALDLGRYGGPVWIEYRDAILQHLRSHRPEGRERVGEEQVHAMCSYLAKCEGASGRCNKCPPSVPTPYGPGEQFCYSIALETLEKAASILQHRRQSQGAGLTDEQRGALLDGALALEHQNFDCGTERTNATKAAAILRALASQRGAPAVQEVGQTLRFTDWNKKAREWVDEDGDTLSWGTVYRAFEAGAQHLAKALLPSQRMEPCGTTIQGAGELRELTASDGEREKERSAFVCGFKIGYAQPGGFQPCEVDQSAHRFADIEYPFCNGTGQEEKASTHDQP